MITTNDISDEELYMLYLEENEDAKNILYERYSFIIDINVNKYKRIALKSNIDLKDLRSEALLGFSDALTSYRSDAKASIPTFISLCVDRRIKKLIIKANRLKNTIMKEAYSLDYMYDRFGSELLDIISDKETDPLDNMMNHEHYEELLKRIRNNLSNFELKVFKYMQDGYNYKQIALILKKNAKQVDNAMQRIKNKIKIIIEELKNLE